MNKRIVSFVLCLCLCMSLLAVPGVAANTSGTCGTGVYWSLSDDYYTLTISGNGSMDKFSSYTNAPWYSSKNFIKNVVIQSGVTSISQYAFYEYTSLNSVTIPDTVTSIGDKAFYGCKWLAGSITIPEGTTSIGDYAFYNCNSLEGITIPASVTSIGDYAFYGCYGLTDVALPDGLISIGELAFRSCYGLTSIAIPNSVINVGAGAFAECTNLADITFEHTAGDDLVMDATAFSMSSNVSVDVYVPEGYINAAIYNYAWSDNHIAVTYKSIDTGEVITPTVFVGYTAGISAISSSVTDGDTVTINVAVSHGEDASFNAGEIKVSYDTAKLSFVSATSGTVKNENGVITLEDYGADKTCGTAVYALTFTAVADGSATVTMISAAFADKVDAEKSDLIAAEISPATAVVTIEKKVFNVTLPEGFSGANTVTDGENYTFTITDTNHTYSNVTATVGGTSVAVTKNDDGSYTVPAVSGTLEITATATPKSYNVTIKGTAADDITDAADTATYSTDYAFTMPSADGWAYELASITIAGVAYTGYSVANSVYTIPGTAITGEIEITVNKTRVTITIEVEGTGAGAAAGYEVSANVGEDYTLTITPVAGYTYTVTVTMGDGAATVIDNGDNTYTIKAVSDDIVFTVERAVVVDGVSVSEYLTFDGTMLWLVKNATTLAEGSVSTYDGSNMFWSEKYNAYCYLVIAGTLSAEDAKAKVGIADGTVTNVDYGMDVNGTGKVDASDAQLVYNMYNASYGTFTEDVTMEKFLRADVNTDGNVNTEDAAAIISSILG